jgi:hypothetical protein
MRMRTRRRLAAAIAFTAMAMVMATAGVAVADTRWCLSMSGLGPVRAGMTLEEVLPLADWSGLPRRRAAEGCWYLRHEGGTSNFRLMIIDGRVARIELRSPSSLQTFAGARIGATEADLTKLYGARLDVRPHKYDEHGHTITLQSGAGDFGLRFETSGAKVTAIQAGAWEHLNYVEGCS